MSIVFCSKRKALRRRRKRGAGRGLRPLGSKRPRGIDCYWQSRRRRRSSGWPKGMRLRRMRDGLKRSLRSSSSLESTRRRSRTHLRPSSTKSPRCSRKSSSPNTWLRRRGKSDLNGSKERVSASLERRSSLRRRLLAERPLPRRR